MQNLPFRRRLIQLSTAVATVAVLVGIAGVAAACPNCREGLAESDPHGQAIAAGFYYSILFMMGMPFALVGSLSFLAYRSVKRHAAEINGEA